MKPQKLSSNALGLLGLIFLISALCVECNASNHDVSDSLLEKKIAPNALESAKGNDVIYWPWPTRKFKCPTAFGAYPDPNVCSHFYICVAKIATRTRCPFLYRFCKVKRVCLPMLMAVCDEGSGEVTDEVFTDEMSTDEVFTQEVTTRKENQFVCPYEEGQFLYPHDCTKYYDCNEYQHTLKTCPDSQLFDGIQRKCRSAEKVHCGSRVRPTDTTPFLETTTNIQVTTDAESLTTTEERTSSPGILTTDDLVTVTKSRVTAPDTDCDEDDLDCIINDLGLTPAWFVCPEAVGSYPHPTSTQLFIFCLNWKPLVKKCGQGLVFSEDVMTCVSV